MNFLKKLSCFIFIFILISSFTVFAMDDSSMVMSGIGGVQPSVTSSMDSTINSSEIPVPNFKIYIDKVSTAPETINPGAQFKIKITLKNIGRKDLENVVLKIASVEGRNTLEGFSPVNTTNEILYGKIKKDESAEKEIIFLADPKLTVGLYNFNTQLHYKEKYGNEYEESRLIGILVKNNPSLSLTDFTVNNGFYDETSFDNAESMESERGLNVEFVNSGKGLLKNIMFKVKTSNEEYTKYYGSLEAAEQDYIDLSLFSPEKEEGKLTISYEDELGNITEQEKSFTLEALSQEITATPDEDKGVFSKILGFFKSLFGLN